MLAFGPDGIRPTEDHDALLRFREAISVLAYRASFLGCRLFAVSLLWPTGLSEEMFEELTVLVEVFNGIGVVGAWTLHELVKVVGLALLGLLARLVGHNDQSWVGRSTPILFYSSCPFVWRGTHLGPRAWPCPCLDYR